MYSWDTNSIIQSIKIDEVNALHSDILNPIYLENTLTELKNKENVIFNEFDTDINLINTEYHLSLDKSKIKDEFKKFLISKQKYNLNIDSVKKQTIREISQMKGLKFPQESADFQILCHANLDTNFTLITHDENLFCVLINKIKSIFLIEYVIENKITIAPEKADYLFYKLLKRYDLGLKELKDKFGIIGVNFYSRNIKIRNYLKSINPLRSMAVIAQ